MSLNKQIAKSIITKTGGVFLDSNKILWKIINGEFIGKRSVWTFDFKSVWIEETPIDNIKSWWCGVDSDYSEVFTSN